MWGGNEGGPDRVQGGGRDGRVYPENTTTYARPERFVSSAETEPTRDKRAF